MEFRLWGEKTLVTFSGNLVVVTMCVCGLNQPFVVMDGLVARGEKPMRTTCAACGVEIEMTVKIGAEVKTTRIKKVDGHGGM